MAFSEIATPGDLAWMGVATIAATTAIAFGVVLAAFRRVTWAYVVAGASTAALVLAPLASWMSAQSSAERFGGGTTMVWMMVFPAVRIYALLAVGLAVTNVALFLSKR